MKLRSNCCALLSLDLQLDIIFCVQWPVRKQSGPRLCHDHLAPVQRSRRRSRAPSPTKLSSSTPSVRCCRARPLDARRRPWSGSGRTTVALSSLYMDSSSRSAMDHCGSCRLPTPRTARRSTQPSVCAAVPPTMLAPSSVNWFESEQVSAPLT